MKKTPIYLDSAATTTVDPRVLEVMLPYFSEIFGNASSSHFYGNEARKVVEIARTQVSNLLGVTNKEIIFTSCATESINLALKGYVEANYEKGNHIITVKTEHKAVLATCEYLETKGVEVTYLDVDENGIIILQDLVDAIRKETLLISIMYVNNETGVIQPVEEIGQIAKENNVIFFCDATQAIGKVGIDIEKENIDMLCFSGHKINGPKGIGILYTKRGIALTPLFHGGGQENGLRAGTYNTPLIVGLGKACEISGAEMKMNSVIIKNINNYLLQELQQIEGFQLIGSKKRKVFNIIEVLIPRLNFEIFTSKFNNLSLSNGSACTSQIIESSHVLKAMGLSDIECNQCIRISIDKTTTTNHIDELIISLKNTINL